MKNFLTVKNLCFSAIVAALYAGVTLLFQPISFGAVQFRISEALTLLPMMFPQAIPGLTIGCLLANLLGSATPWDIVLGTLASLWAAYSTYLLRKNIWIAAIPPVACNAVIIGLMLHFVFALPLLETMASVGFGQAVVVYVLGVPLMKTLEKIRLPKWLV